MVRTLLIALGALVLGATPVAASRLKDLIEVQGFRGNQLTGMGLVVGLNGTGDQAVSNVTRRPLSAMMRHMGTVIDPNDILVRNTALVMVTATLPPFARSGMGLDVVISSVGTAKSLQGGTLVSTALKGADGQVYALAQGPLLVGGYAVEGGTGSSTKKNHVTVARIPSGATVEREGPGGLPHEEVVLVLHDPDPTTASRISAAINQAIGEGSALVRDPAAVVVKVPAKWLGKTVELVATLEAVEAIADAPARIVIDERSGTVVVGSKVSLSPVSIAYGGLTVNVAEQPAVSQPNPLSPAGQTQVVPQTQLAVEEKEGRLQALAEAATVGDVAAALNALGAKPRDLIAIFQALRAAGALHAEIEVL